MKARFRIVSDDGAEMAATYHSLYKGLCPKLSTNNTLFSFVYEHFKDDFRIIEENKETKGIESRFQESITIEGSLNFEGTEYTSTFAVVKANDTITQLQEDIGVQLHGILGIPFLMENNWNIDFEKMIVTCP